MKAFLAAAVLLCLSAPASAQGMDHMKMGHDAARSEMCFPTVSTGSADEDFMRNMIPHHQMAVEMAKEELTKGKDPEARKLAEAIVAAQEKEIAQMNAWVARREKKDAK